MPVSDIYSEYILEKIIKDKLLQGINPSIDEIEESFLEFTSQNDLSNPLFKLEDFEVERYEESSASKINAQNNAIQQDMNIALKTMLNITDRTVLGFNRWNNKIVGLQNRLVDLENRIDNLLLVSQDTSGYFDTVGDHFNDTSKINLDTSSGVFLNSDTNVIRLSDENSGNVTRIFLDQINSQDVTFNIINSVNQATVGNTVNTAPYLAFINKEQFWKTNVYLRNGSTQVLGDLTIRLPEITTLSKLVLQLHSSQNNTSLTVTPLYSIDGINYNELPITETSKDILEYGEFIFPELQATYLKFLLEKNGYDLIVDNLFLYEFGAKQISLFAQSFSEDPDVAGILISKDFFIKKDDESIITFDKATLDVCEELPAETSINYFIAAGTAENFTATWRPVSPINTEDNTYPTVIDFSIVPTYTFSGVKTSFDRTGTVFSTGQINTMNPARSYNLIRRNPTTDEIETVEVISTERRYVFPKSNQRILNYQVDTDIDLSVLPVGMWRNVGTKGSIISDTVRGTPRGWEYSTPFYTTVIYISNTSGISINVGEKPIYIDDIAYTGTVSPTVLNQGRHTVKVHKDNWKFVQPNLETLPELKAADILYPFNHKLLIEGYLYSSDWDVSVEQVYKGVDRFAGYYATEISVFDFTQKLSSDDYSKFAIDIDVPGISTLVSDDTIAPISSVFLINTNESIGDFSAEEFLVELNLSDSEFKYVRFKAELRTQDPQTTPVLDAYRIKLG